MKYVIVVIGGALVLGGAWLLLGDQGEVTGERAQSDTDRAQTDESLTIATSFYPLQYVVERIVDERAEVTNIGAGRDPHDFQPSTQDVLRLQTADLAVFQGAGFEPWADAQIDRLRADGVSVFIAADRIELQAGGHAHAEEAHAEEDDHSDEADREDEHAAEEDDHAEDDHAGLDPHTWLDPIRLSETVGQVVVEISRLDPANAATYEANAAMLQSELLQLDAEYQARLGQCALSEVITSHDAFGYVADRYGFSIHTIAGLSTQDTPSAQTLANLRTEAEEGINAILLEENSVTAYGETLARETGLQTLSVNPVSYVIPEGEDYMSLMRANLNSFATALNCND